MSYPEIAPYSPLPFFAYTTYPALIAIMNFHPVQDPVFPAYSAQHILVALDVGIENFRKSGKVRIALNQRQRFDAFDYVEIAAIGFSADFRHAHANGLVGSFGVAGENSGLKSPVVPFQLVEPSLQRKSFNLRSILSAKLLQEVVDNGCFFVIRFFRDVAVVVEQRLELLGGDRLGFGIVMQGRFDGFVESPISSAANAVQMDDFSGVAAFPQYLQHFVGLRIEGDKNGILRFAKVERRFTQSKLQ